MILLDSSGWIEIVTDGPRAAKFERHLREAKRWIVSPINLFEVYRKVAKISEDRALRAVAAMKQGEVVPVDEQISLEAADLALKYNLAMADSIILATALACGAKLITGDTDFANIRNCVVIR